MIADPAPNDSTFFHDSQSAVFKTDTNRVNVILAFHFLEVQSGVRRIALEEAIGAFGLPLSIQRQA